MINNKQYHIESIVHHLYELCRHDDSAEAVEQLQIAIDAAKSLFNSTRANQQQIINDDSTDSL